MGLLLGTHNLTEGVPTALDLRCDLFAGQEVGNNARAPFRKAGSRVYRPTRDPRQMLAWNPDKIEMVHTGYRRFHLSGKAERFGRIATPPRGLIFMKARRPGGRKIALGGTWLLNSWGKPGEDERKEIVTELELPVIRDWLRDVRRWGAQEVYLLGDFNNIRWGGHGFPPLVEVAGHRKLDRIFALLPDDLDAGPAFEGPTTGVGPDRRHHSLHVNIK